SSERAAPGPARYNRTMRQHSEAMRTGFALAALLSDDRELTLVHGAVSAELAAGVHAVLARAAALPRAERIAGLLDAVRPPLTRLPSSLSARMPALRASKLPRELARRARHDAPPVRAGYAPAP